MRQRQVVRRQNKNPKEGKGNYVLAFNTQWQSPPDPRPVVSTWGPEPGALSEAAKHTAPHGPRWAETAHGLCSLQVKTPDG